MAARAGAGAREEATAGAPTRLATNNHAPRTAVTMTSAKNSPKTTCSSIKAQYTAATARPKATCVAGRDGVVAGSVTM